MHWKILENFALTFCFCKNHNFHVGIRYLQNAKCPYGKEHIIILVLLESVTINGMVWYWKVDICM